MKRIFFTLYYFLFSLAVVFAQPTRPRIINFVNFARQNDYRVAGSEDKLFEATRQEALLLQKYGLPGTFLLQYDALMDSRYQELMKQLPKSFEVGAWWEITQPQVEAAGLTWRGDHPWVSTANIAFTTGYTQTERRKLVDIYMKQFHRIFGRYPQSVGSWFIDAYTLQYMYEKYHIVASCNCKDQIGTDGYTLWGGYWNQAYYPSRVNGYMPAQNTRQQIPVPVFRMLGSDPLDQYDSGLGGNGQGVVTLEPVYPQTGRNRQWVKYFLDVIASEPCLAFNYAQAGQENSFTWPEIKTGLEMQVPIIASMAKAGKLRVETLAASGQWFRKHFKVTPATSVVAQKESQGGNRHTAWFNSRYYRANVLLDQDSTFRFRDIHLFDEKMPSTYFEEPGTSSHFTFTTLPIVDGFQWSSKQDVAGLRLVSIGQDGSAVPIKIDKMTIHEKNGEELIIDLNTTDDKKFVFHFREDGFAVQSDKHNPWALQLNTEKTKLPFVNLTPRHISAVLDGFDYHLSANEGYFQRPASDSAYVFRIRPEQGRMTLDCTNSPLKTEPLQLNGNRFLTLCLMIRTTPWEVSRDVKLHPRDEASWHTLESVKAIREAFAKNNEDGRLTWGFTLNALEDQRENYRQIRQYAVECHYKYGDEISYFPGYFPAMYLPRERINREMSEAIHEISQLVGKGYKPQCIMGGFLSADNLKYLSEKEGIHVAHACIWSQHAIDGGGADGSVSYPYYPSTQHFCKPAQGQEDFIDCVNLDGWTTDFICARRTGAMGHDIHGYNSRRGVGPIETYKGWGLDLGHREVMHTESIHYDSGYELNGFGWVTNIWETQMYHEFGKQLVIPAMEEWIGDTKKRWPDVHFVTFGEFGELWRAQHKKNDFNYRFFERGSGLGDSYNNLELRWFMNPKFRLALLRDWHKEGSPAYVIDFTRYDLPAREPDDATPAHPHKDWSLMNVINQKQTRQQDRPCLLQELSEENQDIIRSAYPELFQ